jgi:hypothetical protein
MYKKISDYGIIGNFNTVALVGNDGSIDWLCLPYIDSPSVFGALLDERKGGRFSISPAAEYDSTAAYVAETNILTTTFRVRGGIMRLTDFMPVSARSEEHVERESCEIYRLVEVLQGEVEINVLFAPRFDYARAPTTLHPRESAVLADGSGEGLVLSATHPGLMIRGDRAEARWRLKEGDRVWLNLRHGLEGPYNLDKGDAERAPRFFGRIQYLINGMVFSADDIEHGF